VPLTSASESRGGAPFGSERDAAEPARRVCALLAFAALRAAVRPMGARGLPSASSCRGAIEVTHRAHSHRISSDRQTMTTTTRDIDEPRSVASAASPRPAPPRHDEYRPDPERWKALAVALAAGFMTLLDVSTVNVALPSIEPARVIARRLRVGVPPRHHQHRRVRCRRARARAGGRAHARL
jgi:hypothetical protein